MTRTTHPGFALLFTLVAIVLVSALVSATMFRITENNYLAQLTTLKLHTMAESERRLWTTLADPALTPMASAPIGTVKTLTWLTGETTTLVTVTKVDSTMLWLVATANTQRGRLLTLHRTGVSARLHPVGGRLAQPISGPAWVDLY